MTRASYIIAAILMFAAFFGLGTTEPGLEIAFIPSWTNSTTGELYTWLGIVFLILPASVFASLAWQQELVALALKISAAVRSTHDKNPRALLLAFFLGGLVFAMAGNRLVLHGFPFTDDEWAARYAGQLLANGQLMEPIPSYVSIVPTLFFYFHDGMMTAFDWLGAIWPWTVAELTFLQNDFFALLSAATLAAFGALITRRLGPSWGFVGVVLLMVSPMGASLSITTHAHLVSRAFLCFSILTYLVARDRDDHLFYGLTGFLAGVGWMTRPPEITLLWLPLAALLVVDAVRSPQKRKGLALFLMAGVIPVAIFCAYSLSVTGSILPPRLAPNDLSGWAGEPPLGFLSSMDLLKERLGSNVSYNLFMLTIWALGPLALGLAWIGARQDRFTLALAIGVLLDLALGLLHDNFGLHMVGPIHYSETIIPILILVVSGLARIKTLEAQTLQSNRWIIVILSALILSNAFFTLRHFGALEKQGEIHETIYGYFDDPKFDNSVVFGPSYLTVWKRFPEFKRTGSFVGEWRRVDPRGNERVVFLLMPPHQNRALAYEALAKYPDRNVFGIKLEENPPYLNAVPMAVP